MFFLLFDKWYATLAHVAVVLFITCAVQCGWLHVSNAVRSSFMHSLALPRDF